MYQKKSRQCCAAMLIVSVCLRLCMFLGLDKQLSAMAINLIKQPRTAQALLYLETGQTAQVQPQQEELIIITHAPQKLTAAPTREEVKTVSWERIAVAGGCSYSYDKQALLTRKSTLDLSANEPQILIIHSHATEAYTPSDGLEYDELSDYRTLDETRNVIAVGAVLAETLRQNGVEVIHDTGIYDYPDYNSSYYNSLQKILQWKKQYPGLQIVVDVHRDAVEDKQGQTVALLDEHEGQQVAQLMLVVGTDEGGLEHPNWQENLANALKLQSVLMGEYPDLCRKLDLRTERFNQHTAPGAILVEVGTNGNTLTQAKASAVLLGEGLAKLINTLQANNGTLPLQNDPQSPPDT